MCTRKIWAAISWEVAAGCAGALGAALKVAALSKARSVFDRPMEHRGEAGCVTSDERPCEASLMLMECDSGAQRCFFSIFEFDICGGKLDSLKIIFARSG